MPVRRSPRRLAPKPGSARFWQLLLCMAAATVQFPAPSAAAAESAGQGVVALRPTGASGLPEIVHAYQLSDILPDPASRLSIDEVRSIEMAGRFEPNRTRRLPLGVGNGTVWLRLRLSSDLSDDHTWWVRAGHWGLVELFLERGGRLEVARTGAFLPLSERAAGEVHPGEYFLPVAIAHGPQEAMLYLRLTHDLNLGKLPLDPELYRELPRWASRSSTRRLFALGLMMGVLAALALYHLVLFAGVREKVYLTFALALVGRAFKMAAGNLVFFELLWPEAPLWDYAFGLVQIPLWIVPFYLFFMSFLNTRVETPRVHRMLVVLMLSSLLDPLGAWLHPVWLWPAHATATVVWAAVPLLVSAASLRKRSREGLIFLAANVLMLAYFIVSVLSTIGISLLVDLPAFGWYLGIMLAAVLFAVAVAEHMRELRRRKEQARRDEAASLLQLRQNELDAARLAAELGQTRLRALRNQLQPRFLFTSLGTVAAEMHSDATLAGRRLSLVADVLRTALQQGSTGEVPLSTEVVCAARFLELERASRGAGTVVAWEIEPEASSALVPHLILLELLDPALHRQVTPLAASEVTIGARRDGGCLLLAVRARRASAPGDDGGRREQRLATTSDRLRHFYGEAAHVTWTEVENDGLEVLITLPFRTGEAAA